MTSVLTRLTTELQLVEKLAVPNEKTHDQKKKKKGAIFPEVHTSAHCRSANTSLCARQRTGDDDLAGCHNYPTGPRGFVLANSVAQRRR